MEFLRNYKKRASELKMRIYVCQNCLKKNKIGIRIKGRTCKKCGSPLD